MLIDAHTHAFAPGQMAARDDLCARDATFAQMYGDPKARMVDCSSIAATMGRAGFDAAVVAGFAFTAQRDLDEQNAHLLEGAAEHPGVVIPVATVNPALAGWEQAAAKAIEGGARGLGELRPHNQGWDPAGPEGHRLAAFAREHDVVLLWHASEPVGHAYPGKTGGIRPDELYRVAEAFPGLRMVGAHFGGGLPFYLQMPEVNAALSCVTYDTAAASLLYDEQSVTRLVDLAGPGRVAFASDYPLQSPGRQLRRITTALPKNAIDDVCGNNASKLYLDTTRA